MNRRLLLVSYDSAPLGSSGCRRLTQMISQLHSLGWDIALLSAQWNKGSHAAWDPSLLERIPPSVRIIRTWNLDNWRKRCEKVEPASARVLAGHQSRYVRIKDLLRTLWIAGNIPDPATTWRPLALLAGLREIWARRPDVIMATSPAPSNLLVGRALSWFTGIPLVSEFRDAWTTEPVRSQLKGISYWPRTALERCMERSVIMQSLFVVSMTDGLTRDFQRRYSGVPDDRFVTVPNGYLLDEFEAIREQAVKHHDRFRIVYTGKLSDRRSPRSFLAALAAFLAQHPEQRGRVHLDIAGVCHPFSDGSTIEEQIAEYGLADSVTLEGFVSRQESLSRQSAADLLLLIVGEVPADSAWVYGLAAKAFDYTLASRPVLCIARDGPTAQYVKHSGIGEVVAHHDIKGIVQALERATTGQLHYDRNEDMIATFEFGALVERLSSLLCEAVSPT